MKKLLRLLSLISCLLLSGVLLLLLASEFLISSVRDKNYNNWQDLPYNRVGIVLGTANYLVGGGNNPYFQHRIKAAAELFHKGKVDYLLVSGDNATLQYNEPRQMRRALIKAGVPAAAIYSDFAGFRTLDSIIRAKEVFGLASFTVISQRFHNERAIYIAQHYGIEAVGYNADDINLSSGLKVRARESLARLLGLFDLYILDRKPKFLGEPVLIGPDTPQFAE